MCKRYSSVLRAPQPRFQRNLIKTIFTFVQNTHYPPAINQAIKLITDDVDELYHQLFPKPTSPTQNSFFSQITSSFTTVVKQTGLVDEPIDAFYKKHSKLIETLRSYPPHIGLISLFRDSSGLSLLDHLFIHNHGDKLQELAAHHEPVLSHALDYLSNPSLPSTLEGKPITIAPITQITPKQKETVMNLIQHASREQLTTVVSDIPNLCYAIELYKYCHESHEDGFGMELVYQLIQAYQKNHSIDDLNQQLATLFDKDIKGDLLLMRNQKTKFMDSFYQVSSEFFKPDDDPESSERAIQQYSSLNDFFDAPLPETSSDGHPWAQCLKIGDPNLFLLLMHAGIALESHHKNWIEDRLDIVTMDLDPIISESDQKHLLDPLKPSNDDQLMSLIYFLFQIMSEKNSPEECMSYIEKLSQHPLLAKPYILSYMITSDSKPPLYPSDSTGFSAWVTETKLNATIKQIESLYQIVKIKTISSLEPQPVSEGGSHETAMEIRDKEALALKVYDYLVKGLEIHDQQRASIRSQLLEALKHNWIPIHHN